MMDTARALSRELEAKSPHVLHYDTLEETVQNAERMFVLKDYEKALELSVEALGRCLENDYSQQSYKDHETSDCIRLQTTPLNHVDSQLPQIVCLTLNVSLADRAAVVALQSGYELSNDAGLTAFCDFHRQRPMSLDVATLWIQYSFRNEKTMSIVEVTAELLHYVCQCPAVPDSVDDLWLLLLAEMLPFSTSASFVRNVLHRMDASTWVVLPGPATCYVRANEVNHQAASIVLSRLDTYSFKALNRCREELENLVKETDQDCQQDLSSDNGTLLESQRMHKPKTTWTSLVDNLSFDNWHVVMSRHLLDLFRSRIVKPLFQDENQGTNCGRVAISVLLLYLAWKRRRRLLLLTTSATTFMTSPFREILDALWPQQA